MAPAASSGLNISETKVWVYHVSLSGTLYRKILISYKVRFSLLLICKISFFGIRWKRREIYTRFQGGAVLHEALIVCSEQTCTKLFSGGGAALCLISNTTQTDSRIQNEVLRNSTCYMYEVIKFMITPIHFSAASPRPGRVLMINYWY